MTAALVPPAPVPPEQLSLWRWWSAVRSNVLTTFQAEAYDELVVRGRFLGRQVVILNDPKAVRRVLAENAANYVKPTASIRLITPFTGAGLLLTEGEVWRRQRRRVAHAFTPASIGALMPRFAEAADGLLHAVESQDTIDLGQALETAALDAVLRALFSSSASTFQNRLSVLARDYLGGSDGAGRPKVWDLLARTPEDFAVFGAARRRFQRLWFAEVDALIAAREADGAPRPEPDLLDQLLAVRDVDTGAPLPGEEVRAQVATFIAAGFETTARLLFWTAYLLARDAAEQDRIRAEALAGPSELTGLDDLARLPRLRCVLQESLRLYPTVPMLVRRALADDDAAGVGLRAGDRVVIAPWVMHRHRRLWPDPAAFVPGRFEGRPSAHLTGGAYIPFAAGPRICIGASFAIAEASVLLTALLRRYALALADARPVMPVGAVSIRPDHSPRFRLTPIGQPLRHAA